MKNIQVTNKSLKTKPEPSTYTPQTDLNDILADTVVMGSSGIIDMEGTSVHSNDQMNSAIQTLQENVQGTMYVPHGSVPYSYVISLDFPGEPWRT